MNIAKQLKNLEDELIDNIINTPDLEILKEVEEDYGNSNYLANRFNKILEKAKNEVNNNRRFIVKFCYEDYCCLNSLFEFLKNVQNNENENKIYPAILSLKYAIDELNKKIKK